MFQHGLVHDRFGHPWKFLKVDRQAQLEMDATNLGIHPTSPMAIKLAKANRLNHAFIWRGGEAVEAYSGIIKAAPLRECQDRRAIEFHLKYHRERSFSVRAWFAKQLAQTCPLVIFIGCGVKTLVSILEVQERFSGPKPIFEEIRVRDLVYSDPYLQHFPMSSQSH